MNCPVCDARLRAVERHGVEVDICPDCKGVWLDRGELEKILDIAAGGGASASDRGAVPSAEGRPRHSDRDDRRCNDRRENDRRREDDHSYDDRDSHSQRPKRRGSWLSEILDSFGGGD